MTHFYDVDLTAPEPRPRVHGKFCTPECDDLSSPCHLSRPRRATPTKCPHCGAAPGFPCVTMTRRERRIRFAGTSHPSRLEAA